MFVVKYDVGHDLVNQTYQTVGGFVNVGFQLENLFRGESPFSMPEPIFKSPRSLRYMLTEKVKRDWHQSTAIVITRQGQGGVCNTDRVLDNVAMTPVPPGLGFGTAAPVPFAPVPVACLQTGRGIVVEIDYSTASPSANANLVVVVDGTAVFNINNLSVPNGANHTLSVRTAVFNINNLSVPNGANHTLSVPLTIHANRQDAFIAAGDNPIQIGIVFFDFSMSSATVQEVRIRFNRP